jgi:hypothetical protein
MSEQLKWNSLQGEMSAKGKNPAPSWKKMPTSFMAQSQDSTKKLVGSKRSAFDAFIDHELGEKKQSEEKKSGIDVTLKNLSLQVPVPVHDIPVCIFFFIMLL